MTKEQIIEHAYNLTERKVNQEKLSLDAELNFVIQDLLQEQRFWWAKKIASFTTVSGTSSYDLTDTAIVTDANSDIGEIIGVYLIESDGSVTELIPLIEPTDQIAAINETTRAKPSCWFIAPGTYGTLRFQAPADGAYTIKVMFWAAHNFNYSSGSVSGSVPVVPPFLHYGLVTGLKMRIFDFLYGQKDPRYITALAQWRQFVKDAARKPSFATQQVREHGANIEAVRAY